MIILNFFHTAHAFVILMDVVSMVKQLALTKMSSFYTFALIVGTVLFASLVIATILAVRPELGRPAWRNKLKGKRAPVHGAAAQWQLRLVTLAKSSSCEGYLEPY